MAQQRKTGSNKTGMSEQQLSDFAGSRVTKSKQDRPGRSIIDVEIHERKPEHSSLKLEGFYATPGQECHEAEKTHEHLSSWRSREVEDGPSYELSVEFYGPDTPFRTEEINPHHYGRDYNPLPLRDYFKAEKSDDRQNLRLVDEYAYEEIETPGTVPSKGLESSLAYGSISYEKIPSENDDNRSFKSQREYRRSQAEMDEDVPIVKDLDEY